MRWRNILICFLLAAALVLVPNASAYALLYGVGLEATTIPWGGTPLLIDGQFTELYFWPTVPSYQNAVVNSTYVARDNGYNLEVGRVYNASAALGIPLRNPVGFVAYYVNGKFREGFMDGVTRTDPYISWLPNIYFVNGWWYGFELQRDRSGGLYSDRYEVRLWDPNSGIWTHVASWAPGETGIVSARGILGCERNSTSDPPANTWYGTFYRSQYRTWNGPEAYSYWPGGMYAPSPPWRNNDLYTQPPCDFWLNHINEQWIYCSNTGPI